MTALFLLLLIFFHGETLVQALHREIPSFLKHIAGFVFGVIFSFSEIYWVASLVKSLDISLLIFLFISFLLLIYFREKYVLTIKSLRINMKMPFIFILLFSFSYWLFTKTFSYDTIHNNLLVASNVYMDFGAHISFIRSFSLGNNFPGEVPFFGNSGLLYYFLFDFTTGVLEHIGLRIDIAYNLISVFSFTFLLYTIYYLAVLIFKKRLVGILSIVFFWFSSDLSFVNFFEKYGFSKSLISYWWHNNFYFQGSPLFFSKTISPAIFWTLDTYVNQRHLIFGALYFLTFLYFWISQSQTKKQSKLFITTMGISLGLFVMWHAMIFLAGIVVIIMVMILYKNIRKSLLITLIITVLLALPQIILIKLHSADMLMFKPGFILDNMLTLGNFAHFWIINLGFSIITIPIGFFLANKEQKKFFLILLPLFLLPNIFHFSSRNPFDDHKYFSLWIIGMNFFSAYTIYLLYKKNLLSRFLSFCLIILLTLSGIIALPVTKNDIYAKIPDYQQNKLLTAIKTTIPNGTIVMTNGEIYDPATLVGKKTFVGRVQYIYVYGGNASQRLAIQQRILQPTTREDMIQAVQKNRIQYLILYKNDFAKNEKPFNKAFYDSSFVKIYEDNEGIIYKI